MSGDIVFLYLIAAISFAFAVFNSIFLVLKKNKMAKTTGTIIDVTTRYPERQKIRNSKWARFTYTVNGRTYTSHNRLQVPMTMQIGSRVLVRYDTEHPEKLYSFSILRVVAALIVTAICIFVAALL